MDDAPTNDARLAPARSGPGGGPFTIPALLSPSEPSALTLSGAAGSLRLSSNRMRTNCEYRQTMLYAASKPFTTWRGAVSGFAGSAPWLPVSRAFGETRADLSC